MLLKARSIRWVPQLELVSEEKAPAHALPCRFPHQHGGLLDAGVGAAQPLEHPAGVGLAQSAQQRSPAYRQVLLPRRAGIHHRLCGFKRRRGQLRQHHRQHGGFQIRPRLRGNQQLCQFLLNALGRDAVQVGCQLPRCPGSGSVQRKAKPCGKAVQPQNTQRILGEPLLRLAYRPQQTVLQIFLPAKGVYQTLGFIISHGVDGKIPPGKIRLHLRHKLHGIRVAAVMVLAIHTVGGDFVGGAAHDDGNGAVLFPR